MNIFKRGFGGFLYYLAKFIHAILNGLISITAFISELILGLGKGILRLLLGVLSMGGILLFLLLGPYALFILFNPIFIFAVLFFIFVPILGTKFVAFLRYIRYTITEYLYDRSDYFKSGKRPQFQTFSEYGAKYKRKEQEQKRYEQSQRQQEAQRQWEENFRRWHEYQRQQRGGGYWGQGGTYNSGQRGYSQGPSYTNPSIGFKQEYEKNCDILGVNYSANKDEIKLAYRNQAKKYHPDINKSSNATEMFQKINAAYEFFSDENIARYRNLS